MSVFDNLYKEIILEHYKSPRNRGKLDPHTVRQEGVNPSCGDELELYLLIDGDQVTDVTFEGVGCAIRQASDSMMTAALKGEGVAEVRELAGDLTGMSHGGAPKARRGDGPVLAGTSKQH